MVEWLSSWLAEQEDRGSIPGLATWIFRDWLSPASKSRYGWKIAKSTLILKTTNQPTIYDKTWRYQFPYYKLSDLWVAISHLHWCFCLTTHSILNYLFLLWLFILRAACLSRKLPGQGYVKDIWTRLLLSFMVGTGMLHDNLEDEYIPWDLPLVRYYINFLPVTELERITELDFYLNARGSHKTFAMGVACQQRTLTPPDTWSCPTFGTACILMLRPISPKDVLFPDFLFSKLSTSV